VPFAQFFHKHGVFEYGNIVSRGLFQTESDDGSAYLECNLLFLDLILFAQKNEGSEFGIVINDNELTILIFDISMQSRD